MRFVCGTARSSGRARLRRRHAASRTEAVGGASAVITVLRDGDAVTEVMADAIAGVDETAVWIQASTVGPRSASALAELARDHSVAYLDAPVSGSTTPAREGKLVWLVAGEDAALSRARPVLDVLGSSVLHVGTGAEGSSLKLAINAWMTAATVAMSDVLALCDALGIDHATFVRALAAGPLAMPYGRFRGATRIEGHQPRGGTDRAESSAPSRPRPSRAGSRRRAWQR